MAMQEANESFGTMLRWTEQPKDQAQAEKTVYRGTVVQGYYVGKRDGVGQNDSTVYEILTPQGEKLSFWGSGLLDGKLNEVPLNCEIRVTCLGVAQPKTPGGRPYLNFKVEFDKDSKKPANLVEVQPAQGAAPIAPPTTATAAPVPTAAPVAPVVPATAPAAPAVAPTTDQATAPTGVAAIDGF